MRTHDYVRLKAVAGVFGLETTTVGMLSERQVLLARTDITALVNRVCLHSCSSGYV